MATRVTITTTTILLLLLLVLSSKDYGVTMATRTTATKWLLVALSCKAYCRYRGNQGNDNHHHHGNISVAAAGAHL